MKIIKSILISLFFVPLFVFAQNQAVLPNAGLTPESPFYFLDKLGEALERFFTFNPESRAKLEITFAKERIAEIKVILEDKGVNAEGLAVAEERLGDNLSRATAILVDQKQEGKDTSKLAKELSDDFDPAHEALKNTFKSEADALDAKIDELKAKLKEASLAGDTTQAETLTKEIADLKAQKELLEQHEDKDDGDIEEENEHLDEALGLQKEAAEKIKDAEEEKADIVEEATEEKYDVPESTFKEFDTLLSQAKAALDTGNYEGAKRLAKEAKKNLKETEKQLENLKDAKDEEEDLNDEEEIQQHELENKLKDADKEEAEQIREEMKQKSSAEEKVTSSAQGVMPAAKDTSGYTFTITGSVYDLTNAPAMTPGIPMAGIAVRSSGPKTVTTQTRTDGSYTLSFANATVGIYDVCVTIPAGYRMNPSSGCESVTVRLSEKYVKTLELINNGNTALHGTIIHFNISRQQISTACQTDYNPFCGKDGKTYHNACFAGEAGVEISYPGECRAGMSVTCSGYNGPMCGYDNKTYPNECAAKEANVMIQYVGECS